jgi:hypothetical protein
MEPNYYGKIEADIKEFNDILYHKKLRLTKDHTIGKIDLPVTLPNIHEVKPQLYKEYKEDKTLNLYMAGNTFVTWINLKSVAHDAKIEGLLKNEKIETLFDAAKFFVSAVADRPLIIKLDKWTYFIAPVIDSN